MLVGTPACGCESGIRKRVKPPRKNRQGQAAKGQTLPLESHSPPDRDCSERQSKTVKPPRREVGDRHARLRNEPIFELVLRLPGLSQYRGHACSATCFDGLVREPREVRIPPARLSIISRWELRDRLCRFVGQQCHCEKRTAPFQIGIVTMVDR
jgi:hypothetical protein